MIKLLRLGDSAQCGHVTAWRAGQTYSIFETRGCQSLGVEITENDYALIKEQRLTNGQQYLSISQLKHEESNFYDQITYFSPKLKLCSHEPDKWINADLPLIAYAESSGPAFSLFANNFILLILCLASRFVLYI